MLTFTSFHYFQLSCATTALFVLLKFIYIHYMEQELVLSYDAMQ